MELFRQGYWSGFHFLFQRSSQPSIKPVSFSGNILPLTLFPDSWQRIITLLPYAQLLDTPIRLYTGEYTAGSVPEAFLIQIVWTVLLVYAGCLFWRMNQRKLIIQGG